MNLNRNLAILLIAAGMYIALGKMIGPFTTAALTLVLFGLYNLRSSRDKAGYLPLAIGAFVLISNHFAIVIGIILLSLGFFYIHSRQTHRDMNHVQKQNVLQSIKWDREPWELKNMSIWFLAGEVRLDLSHAIQDQRETTVVIQGILADIDIIVPEDYGVIIESSILIGQVGQGTDKETALMNKRVWRSPNYEESDHKVKLVMSFIVADIDVRIL